MIVGGPWWPGGGSSMRASSPGAPSLLSGPTPLATPGGSLTAQGPGALLSPMPPSLGRPLGSPFPPPVQGYPGLAANLGPVPPSLPGPRIVRQQSAPFNFSANP